MPYKMSNYLENVLAEKILRGTSWGSQPATTYVGLFTSFTEASDGSSYTEVSGTGYTRRAITWAAPSAATPSGRLTSNTGSISFPAAGSDWGTVTHIGIWSTLTPGTGNLLYWGPVTTPLTILTGEQYTIAANDLAPVISGTLPDAVADAVINFSLRNTAWPYSSGEWWVALISSYTNDSLYTEVADANYDRKQVTFGAASGGVCTNSGELLWDAAAADFNVSYLAIFDDDTGGNLLLRAPLTTPKTVNTGKVVKLPIGSLACTLD